MTLREAAEAVLGIGRKGKCYCEGPECGPCSERMDALRAALALEPAPPPAPICRCCNGTKVRMYGGGPCGKCAPPPAPSELVGHLDNGSEVRTGFGGDATPAPSEECKRCDGRGNTNRHIPFPDPCPACGGTGQRGGG